VRCSNVQNQLVAWLEGELSAADAERIELHVGSCTPCREQKGFLQQTHPNPLGESAPPMPESSWVPMHDAVMEAFDARDLERRRRSANQWMPPLPRERLVAMAYAAALFLAIGWGWASHQEARQARVARDAALQELLRYQQVVAEQQPLTPLPALPQVRPAAYVPYRDTF